MFVDKGFGDMVFVGIINQSGLLEFEVICVVGDIVLVCIIYVVEVV